MTGTTVQKGEGGGDQGACSSVSLTPRSHHQRAPQAESRGCSAATPSPLRAPPLPFSQWPQVPRGQARYCHCHGHSQRRVPGAQCSPHTKVGHLQLSCVYTT